MRSVGITYVAVAVYLSPEAFTGSICAIFVIVFAAAELGLALAIGLRLYRNRQISNVDEADLLKW